MYLCYRAAEFRGKICRLKSWTRRRLQEVGLADQHWKMQKMHFWKSGTASLKFWLF